MADAQDSKSCDRKVMRVRLPPSAQLELKAKMNKAMNKRDSYIIESVRAARIVQNFLWGKYDDSWDLEEWRRMFRKRNQKIDDIDPKKPHALIELRKRLLQNAALSIALLERLDKGMPEENCAVPSNLSAYAKKKIRK